jgi:hypothetical protein
MLARSNTIEWDECSIFLKINSSENCPALRSLSTDKADCLLHGQVSWVVLKVEKVKANLEN